MHEPDRLPYKAGEPLAWRADRCAGIVALDRRSGGEGGAVTDEVGEAVVSARGIVADVRRASDERPLPWLPEVGKAQHVLNEVGPGGEDPSHRLTGYGEAVDGSDGRAAIRHVGRTVDAPGSKAVELPHRVSTRSPHTDQLSAEDKGDIRSVSSERGHRLTKKHR